MGFLANCLFNAVTKEKKMALIPLLIYFFLLFFFNNPLIYGHFRAGIWFCLPCMTKCSAQATGVANELTWSFYKVGIVSSCVPTK